MAINFKHTRNGVQMERYEMFYSTSIKSEIVDYEYVHTDNSRFSCTAYTLEEARHFRDKWLEEKKKVKVVDIF